MSCGVRVREVNAILAQTAALAAHARAAGVDPHLGGDDAYWSRHSTFQFVRALHFVARRRRLFRSVEEEVATTPAVWMAKLPEKAVIELVSGGTGEGIAVSRGLATFYWSPEWTTVAQYPETRIWSVKYSGTAGLAFRASDATIAQATECLSATLREVVRFTSANDGMASWGETFEKAAESFGSSQPLAPYHPDILPARGYTLAARQLLAASVGAFVFGGMGSWNDLGFRDPAVHAEYERLTKELYAAVIGGLVAAVNQGMEE